MIAKAWIEQNLEKILATTVKFLIRSNKITAASILTNAKPSLRGNDPEMYEPRINLAIPAEVYFVLDEDELLQSIERDIDSALSDVRQAQSARGLISCRIVVALKRMRIGVRRPTKFSLDKVFPTKAAFEVIT